MRWKRRLNEKQTGMVFAERNREPHPSGPSPYFFCKQNSKMESNPDFPLLPLGKAETTPSEISPGLRPCAHQLYSQAWEKYRTAGCPFGETEDAMLIWYCLSPRSSEARLVTGKN